jgi:arabinogalactan oligomer/maltooligosaccharide transport system substrate-binding protein
MVRKRIGLACALTLVLGLTACGGDEGEPAATESPAATAAGGGGELIIWADDKRAAALKPFGEQFGEENGVTVRIQAVSKDLQQQFVTASQAGKAPDVVVGAHDWIGNLVQNSAIDPVQIVDPSAFDPIAIKGVTYNGQTYGVPYAVENIALIRNTDLAPDVPASMDALIKEGQSLVKSGKASEIMSLQVGQNGDAYHMMPLFTSGGGAIFAVSANGDYDPSKVELNSQGSIDAMTKISKNGEKGTGALKRSIGPENAIPIFADKKTAYLVSGPWAITDIEKAGVKYDISPVPAWAGGGPAAPFIGVQMFYVASGGKNKTLAQEFVTNFVPQTPLMVALYENEPRRPALLAALEQVSATDPNIAKFQKAGENGYILPAIPAMNSVWEPLSKAQAAIVGGAAVESTMNATQKAVVAAIG